MFGIKLALVAAAIVGAVVASTPGDDICYTAPAVTTTVTVTDCGPVTASESQAHSTATPPVETSGINSWLTSSSAPVPSEPASSPPAFSTTAEPLPSTSQNSPSGSEESSPEPTPIVTASDMPTPSFSETGSVPLSSSEPEQPPSNDATLSRVSVNMGTVVIVGMAINAALAALV